MENQLEKEIVIDEINTEKKEYIFPEFDDIKVSTKTFIAKTNLIIDLKKLFEYLPITEYIVIPKKRGRKKKIEQVDPNKDILNGSIITMKYENQIKGVDLKEKKTQKKKKTKWFRNSFTVVIIIDNKPVNFKICQNGMFQLTGCKFDIHAEKCIKYIWDYIKDQKDMWTFSEKTHLEILFIPAMRNIDFSVGYLIDREKLSKYMSTKTSFYSLLETSFGYTGVNCKIGLSYDIKKMKIKKLIYTLDDTMWHESETIYDEYLSQIPEKERDKKINKDRYNTFLIFHSGRAIMSGLCRDFMVDAYYYFISIIKACRKEVEEILDT
jgi:hypothetical protein